MDRALVKSLALVALICRRNLWFCTGMFLWKEKKSRQYRTNRLGSAHTFSSKWAHMSREQKNLLGCQRQHRQPFTMWSISVWIRIQSLLGEASCFCEWNSNRIRNIGTLIISFFCILYLYFLTLLIVFFKEGDFIRIQFTKPVCFTSFSPLFQILTYELWRQQQNSGRKM